MKQRVQQQRQPEQRHDAGDDLHELDETLPAKRSSAFLSQLAEPPAWIVVADGSVSRKHAKLERRGPVWWVVDQGSANGTYLNSLRIAEQALKNGQEIRFGALAFRVDLKDDPEATVAQPIVTDDSATVMAVAGDPGASPTP